MLPVAAARLGLTEADNDLSSGTLPLLSSVVSRAPLATETPSSDPTRRELEIDSSTPAVDC